MKIIKSTDGKYLSIDFNDIVQKGDEYIFPDGYVFSIDDIVFDMEDETILVSNPNYSISCSLED